MVTPWWHWWHICEKKKSELLSARARWPPPSCEEQVTLDSHLLRSWEMLIDGVSHLLDSNGYWSKPWHLVNPKIAGKWIPLELIIIGFDPPPNRLRSGIAGASLWQPRWVPCHWLLLRYLGRSILDGDGAPKVTRETAENPKKSSERMSKISNHLIPSDTYSTPSMWRMCSALTNRRWRFLRGHVNTSQQRWSSAGSSEGFQSCAKKGVEQWLWC